MRNWKKTDKFTATDYMEERKDIISEIERLDTMVKEIEGEKLILSERPPTVAYDGFLWIDPQEMDFYNSQLANIEIAYSSDSRASIFLKLIGCLECVDINYSSTLKGGYFQREQSAFEAEFNYNSDTTSHKMPQFSSDFVANIIYESGVESYKMPQLKSDFEATLNYNSGTTSYKMPQIKSSLENVAFDYSSNITSTVEILGSSAFEVDINYSSEIIGYKMPQLSSSIENVAFDYSSNTTSTIEILATSAFENVEINYSSELEGAPRQFSESAFEVDINYSSTLEGSPRQFSESGMQNTALTYNSDTVSGVSYSVYARNTAGPPLQMTVQFQGETGYTTSVSGVSNTLIRQGMTSPTALGITAPQSFAQGPVTYVFNRWEVNGVTETPISNSLIVDLEKTTYLVAYYDEFID
jgi:hypothetical protein